MSASAGPARIRLRDILVRAMHPPIREPAFWAIQAMVVAWALVHIEADLHGFADNVLPTGAPIDPLLIPVGYAALRYGLSGSAATAVWASLLWLPDLLLSNDRGHPYQDSIQIAVVIAVALFVGLEIERAHLEQARAEAAEAERRAAEVHYHQLFDTNTSPILLVDPDGTVAEANRAAVALWGSVLGSTTEHLLGMRSDALGDGRLPDTVRLNTQLGEERDYRLTVSRLGAGDHSLRQLVLEDVTEEYLAGSRARTWAGSVLRAQEEECSRIAREIHDDPLQRLLQLARRMEALGSPSDSAQDGKRLGAVRKELLEVVAHLRDVTRGLHPAGLDQLGLVAAVRGLLGDIEVEEGLATELMVSGEAVRGSSEAEVGVFRIIQEAVRNVVRHAEADHLLVELAYDGGSVRMTVTDDGRGFDQAGTGPRAGSHLGILGMRERATLLGGHCDVLTEPDRGTVVRALVPLERDPTLSSGRMRSALLGAAPGYEPAPAARAADLSGSRLRERDAPLRGGMVRDQTAR